MENKKAFSLVEIAVVMSIIAVLAAMIVGGVQIARKAAEETAHRTNADIIKTAMSLYYAKYKTYCGQTSDGTVVSSIPCYLGMPFKDAVRSDYYGMGKGVVLTGSIKSNGCNAYSPSGVSMREGGQVVASPYGYEIRVANNDCSGFIKSFSTKIGNDCFGDSGWCMNRPWSTMWSDSFNPWDVQNYTLNCGC